MAEERTGAHEILALHTVSDGIAKVSGENCETPLDDPTRLQGTQAGVGFRTLGRTRLARLSPSRDLMYRGLWVPGSRAEPFFPQFVSVMLDHQPWGCRPTSAREARRVRPERHNPARSLRCGWRWPANVSDSCLAGPSAEPPRPADPRPSMAASTMQDAGHTNGLAPCAKPPPVAGLD